MFEIYAASDMTDLGLGITNVFHVVTINYQDFIQFLEPLAAEMRYQDPDTRSSAIFMSDAVTAATLSNKEAWYGCSQTMMTSGRTLLTHRT
jgi:hypothetical protein